jgi:hypothetical protein
MALTDVRMRDMVNEIHRILKDDFKLTHRVYSQISEGVYGVYDFSAVLCVVTHYWNPSQWEDDQFYLISYEVEVLGLQATATWSVLSVIDGDNGRKQGSPVLTMNITSEVDYDMLMMALKQYGTGF